MNKEQTKEAIKVMQAWLDGKELECRTRGFANWIPFEHNEMFCFNFQSFEYRIKPGQKYRPFNSAEEVMEAIKEHGTFIKRYNNIYYNITYFNTKEIHYGQAQGMSVKTAFANNFTFIDGTPFGKLVEE